METVSDKPIFVRSENGSMMVSILVLSTVILTFALALTTSLNDSLNLNTFALTKSTQLKAEALLKGALQNNEYCNTNFADSLLDNQGRLSITQLKGKAGEHLAFIDQTLGTNELQITGLSIETGSSEWNGYKTAKITATSPIAVDSKVRIRYRKLKTAMGSRQAFTDIPMRLLIDTSQKIVACDTSDSMGQTLCVQLGGQFNSTTQKCAFNINCATLNEAMLPSGTCIAEQIALIQKEIDVVAQAEATEPEVAPIPTPPNLPASGGNEPAAWKSWTNMVKSCVQNPQSAQFSGEFLSCSLGSFNITANGTSVKMSAGAMAFDGGPDDSAFIRDQARMFILAHLAATQ
ncbi:hypothetical protein ACLVWU_14315 [Bdellovibrio sp. HCB290]|uniref:hypothetical protein n=1 Tax=Bdellovibrio sp. HCB290 TaxID=3394356 RepID=UPI0039B5CACD